MSQGLKFHILKQPWVQCEEIIQAIAEKQSDKITKVKNVDRILHFLVDIKILESNSINNLDNIKSLLTSEGENFYINKFIYKDESACKGILKNLLERYEPVQLICQLLWGKNDLKKESVYRLLLSKGYINYKDFKVDDISSFLMLLNWCNIICYSKKNGSIKIKYNPKTNEEKQSKKLFLSPQTRYTNIKNLWIVLRKCSKYIYWIDKHFSVKGFESLSEEADGTKIKEIKILSGIGNNVNDKLKRDFIRLREELTTRGINIEFRIICTSELLQSIHDRWIISENICFNVPPINSIYQGQYAEIIETTTIPPFQDWWKEGMDLLKDWHNISRIIQSKQ